MKTSHYDAHYAVTIIHRHPVLSQLLDQTLAIKILTEAEQSDTADALIAVEENRLEDAIKLFKKLGLKEKTPSPAVSYKAIEEAGAKK
jgi:hypothetical protein